MALKSRYISMASDDLLWEISDEETRIWEKSIHKAELFHAIARLILKYRPGEAVELHRAIRGGYNIVYRLEYKDGSSAVMRIPRKGIYTASWPLMHHNADENRHCQVSR